MGLLPIMVILNTCGNQLGTGYTMNGFRKAVQAAMQGGGVTTTPSTEKPATGGTGATVKPYLVQVTISDLYIRKGPGTNYGKNGFIKPGVYTIVAESNGNRRFQNGAS